MRKTFAVLATLVALIAMSSAPHATAQALKASQAKRVVNNAAGTVTVDNATNNATSTIMTLGHTTSGTPANGLGGCLGFSAEDSANETESLASLCGAFADVTTTSEDGYLTFFTRAAGGSLTERLRIISTGEVGIGKTPSAGVELDMTGDAAISGTLSVGGGTAVGSILTGTASIDFAAITTATCSDGGTTITVTGAADGDSVFIGVPNTLASTSGVLWSGYVSGANTVTVRGCKISAADTADLAAGTFRATVIHY